MLEMLLVGFVVLVSLAVGLAMLVALPLLLIGGLLRLLVAVLVLPFKILGAIFGAAGTVVAVLFKGLLFLGAALFGLLVLASGVLFVGLLPILLIALAIGILVRATRPAVAGFA